MSSIIWKNAKLTVNGVVLSGKVRSLTFNYGANLQPEQAMGDDSEINLAGVLTWSFDVTFKQDLASGQVDATLFPLVGAAAFPVILQPNNSGVSALNPTYTAQAVLGSYSPFSGGHGDLAEASTTFNSAGTIVRAEA